MSKEIENPHILIQIATFVRDFWTDVSLVLAPFVSAFCGIAFTEEFQKYWNETATIKPEYLSRARTVWLLISIVSVGWLIVSIVFHVLKQKSLTTALKENEMMRGDREEVIKDMRSVISWYLWGISQDLDFQTTDRITLYCHDKAISSFLNICRFCPNPAWEGHTRTNYPDNQGFIGHAWQIQEFFIGDLPDPVRNSKAYVKATSTFNFPQNLHGLIRMKSRLYYGWRINDGNGQRPLAVIMIESTDPARWTEHRLHQYFEEQKGKLHSIFERVHKHLPELSDAAKRGF